MTPTLTEIVRTALVGIMLVLSGAAIGWREILLRPDVAMKYPKATFWVRGTMFSVMLVVTTVGASALFASAAGKAWQMGPAVFALSGCFLLMSVTFLAELLRQGYGFRVHSRIEQIRNLAACPPDAVARKRAAVRQIIAEGGTATQPDADGIPQDRTTTAARV